MKKIFIALAFVMITTAVSIVAEQTEGEAIAEFIAEKYCGTSGS